MSHALHDVGGVFLAGIEWQERLLLINRPWEEDMLHWGRDDHVHGTIAPPGDGHSTTSTGWCLGCSSRRRDEWSRA